MRILILANAQSVHFHRWLIALTASGHEVHVATAEPRAIEGVTVHTLPRYRYQLLRLILSAGPLRRLVAKLKPDIVHAYYLLDYGFMAAFAGMKPLVVTAMGSDVLRGLDVSYRRRFLAGYACRRADYVLTRAEHMNETVRRLGAGGPVEAVPNGIETRVFAFGGARNSVPRVLCTRAFRPVYNIMAFILAIAILKRSGKRADFILVGDGTDRPEIEAAIEREGLEDCITLVGALAHDALPAYYASCDIYVSPSLSDGNSVSLMEALAYGIPVIGGYEDTDLDGADCYLRIDNTENNVDTEVSRIRRFVQQWKGRALDRAEIEAKISSRVKELARLAFFEQAARRR